MMLLAAVLLTASKVISLCMPVKQRRTIFGFFVSQPRKNGSNISGLSECKAIDRDDDDDDDSD